MDRFALRDRVFVLVLGSFFCVVLLEIALRIQASMFSHFQEKQNNVFLEQTDTYRIMCIGESSTALGGKDSYPSQLGEILNQQGMTMHFSVINKGIPATNTSAILSQLEDSLKKNKIDMVIAMMGENDRGETKAYASGLWSPMRMFFESCRTYKLICILLKQLERKTAEMEIRRLNHYIAQVDQKKASSFSFVGSTSKTQDQSQMTDRSQLLFELGQKYRRQGDYSKAELMFIRGVVVNPNNEWGYIGLGSCYRDQGLYIKAVEMLEKAVAINPQNDWAYVELGKVNWAKEDYAMAESKLKMALAVNPKNADAYGELGWNYWHQGDLVQAKIMLKKAIEIDPNHPWAHMGLVWCYRFEKDMAKAEQIYRKAAMIQNPDAKIESSWMYGVLAQCYQASGQEIVAERYFQRANQIRQEYYHPLTRRNYNRLREILDQAGIQLVCVQYPMRKVNSLKKMLGPTKHVIFVDNEVLFKDAVRYGSYEEYFTDMAGGEFGHCTRKGNRLLAENIARVILKQYFNKDLQQSVLE